MAARPKGITSQFLDAAAIEKITSAVVRAVAMAVPVVPEAVASQVRVESEKAVRDISVAASAARRKIQTAVQDGLDSISARIREQEVQTLKLVDARKLVVEHPWLGQSTGGLFFCLVCTKHASLLTHNKQQQSEWIAGNSGVNPVNADCPFRKSVHSHEESAMHQLAVQFDKDRDAMPIATTFGRYTSHAEQVTENLI